MTLGLLLQVVLVSLVVHIVLDFLYDVIRDIRFRIAMRKLAKQGEESENE